MKIKKENEEEFELIMPELYDCLIDDVVEKIIDPAIKKTEKKILDKNASEFARKNTPMKDIDWDKVIEKELDDFYKLLPSFISKQAKDVIL